MTVVEGDYTTFDHYLTCTMTINEDSLKNDGVLIDSIILDGDLADLSVAIMSFPPGGNVIEVKLYGKLIRNSGQGTITVKGEALKKGSDLSVSIPVRWSKD
ncbi:hypothetical protein [uncultured Brevibacillus sp.]|uniref:hypothetical protein n=1 Tax=uncultured Brevibacillus sp. TaxID=169970 RepID=UPI0025958993|nr:hypothetical protein [uncultured Brevibacillus sp.]